MSDSREEIAYLCETIELILIKIAIMKDAVENQFSSLMPMQANSEPVSPIQYQESDNMSVNFESMQDDSISSEPQMGTSSFLRTMMTKFQMGISQ